MKPTHFLVAVTRTSTASLITSLTSPNSRWAPAWCRRIGYADPGTIQTHLYRRRYWAEEARRDIARAFGERVSVTITPMALVPVGDPE